MRSLSKEEIAYLTEKDPASMSRIPVFESKIDDGIYTYDKEIEGDKTDIRISSPLNIIETCRDRIPTDKYSATVVYLDHLSRPVNIAVLDMDKYIPMKDRISQGLDYPLSLKDLSRIGLMSGAAVFSIVFNHPEQDVSGFKKPKAYEEEMLLSIMSAELPGPDLSDIIVVNLKNQGFLGVPKYYSSRYSSLDVIKYSKETLEPFENYLKKQNSYSNTMFSETFDFTLKGRLTGVNKYHLDKWLFYTDRRQKEPIRFEQWANKEIPFTAELLVDPRNNPGYTSDILSDEQINAYNNSFKQDIKLTDKKDKENLEFAKNKKLFRDSSIDVIHRGIVEESNCLDDNSDTEPDI